MGNELCAFIAYFAVTIEEVMTCIEDKFSPDGSFIKSDNVVLSLSLSGAAVCKPLILAALLSYSVRLDFNL